MYIHNSTIYNRYTFLIHIILTHTLYYGKIPANCLKIIKIQFNFLKNRGYF